MSFDGVNAFPLSWPHGWPRAMSRSKGPFTGMTHSTAVHRLLKEVRLLGGKGIILSTNLPITKQGLPQSSDSMIADPGVAIYFALNDRPMCFACDRYRRVEENIRALGLTIEALRGIERWGASDMMERAFSGFAALPPPKVLDWRTVLGIHGENVTAEALDQAYKRMRSFHHPDRGGSPEAFQAVQDALELGKKELGL